MNVLLNVLPVILGSSGVALSLVGAIGSWLTKRNPTNLTLSDSDGRQFLISFKDGTEHDFELRVLNSLAAPDPTSSDDPLISRANRDLRTTTRSSKTKSSR